LTQGLSAPEIAAKYSVSVSCVCRALARKRLTTATQAARQQRARRLDAHAHTISPTNRQRER
jgi:transposase